MPWRCTVKLRYWMEANGHIHAPVILSISVTALGKHWIGGCLMGFRVVLDGFREETCFSIVGSRTRITWSCSLLPFNYAEQKISDLPTGWQILKIFCCLDFVCVNRGTRTDMEDRGRPFIKYLRDSTNVLGFMSVILLYGNRRRVSAIYVAIFGVIRTRIKCNYNVSKSLDTWESYITSVIIHGLGGKL
jgi:hypothetical protein